MDKFSVAADTSALLSLKLCNSLKETLKFFQYFVGKTIKEELEEISEAEDALGRAANSILKQVCNQITLIKTEDFELGENEALQIHRDKETDLLVSDDIEFAKAHEDETNFSTLLLITLVKKNVFTKNELIERLEGIFKKRGWEKNNLIYIATIAELQRL